MFDITEIKGSIALTTNENKAIEDMANKYGSDFASGVRSVLLTNHVDNFTSIHKAKYVYYAIQSLESKCGDKKKCNTARKEFADITSMTTADITRYMSVYTNVYCVLKANGIGYDETLEKPTVDEQLTAYLSKFGYSNLYEIAKRNEKDVLFIFNQYENVLYNISRSNLIWALEPYSMTIAPPHGRDSEFIARVEWLLSGNKKDDYGKTAEQTAEQTADNTPTTAKELSKMVLSFGGNSIGAIADTSTWEILFNQLEKCGIMDVFTDMACTYCRAHELQNTPDFIESEDNNNE